jgi:ABC-type antimicrobial peptide transport system permease subunit
MPWWRSKVREQDLERELNSDLEFEAQEQQDRGLSAEEARYAARRAMGNTTLLQEQVRELWTPRMVDATFQDARYAFRVLRKSLIFTFVAILSLALGIGANTAIFSLVDGLWMRPMPVANPDEIVRLFTVTPQNPEDAFSYPEYLVLNSQARSVFQGLVALGGRGTRIPNADGTSELHTVNVVSDNFFDVLGIRALAGRVFTSQDTDLLNHEPVAVLGNSFWKRRFASDRGIIGKQIELQGGKTKVLFTVLGVLPEKFRDINNGQDRDLWLPTQSWVRLTSERESSKFADSGGSKC